MNRARNNPPQLALKKFVKNILNNNFVQNYLSEKDTILLGLSGGKDSLLLLEILGELSKSIKFKVLPVHVKSSEIGYNVDLGFLENICKEYDLVLKVVETEFKFDPANKKGPCFVCSWHRRKILFSEAQKLNCNKIALGHHMDDAVQTLLLNMIYHGSISSMPPVLSMFGDSLELIRPLLFLNEKDIINFQKLRNYPELIKNCPYGNHTQRNKIRDIIAELEKIHPQAKTNIFRSMTKIYTSYLPKGENGIISGLNVIHPDTTAKD